MIVMIVFADRVSRFVDEHPTLRMLALSFLIFDWSDVGAGGNRRASG